MRRVPARRSSVLLALAAAVAAQLAAAEPSAGTATGALAGYAHTSEERSLTVSSASGATTFHVAADARLWQGSHRLPFTQLASHVGWQVTVSWSEVDGVKTTHTVRLATTPPRRH